MNVSAENLMSLSKRVFPKNVLSSSQYWTLNFNSPCIVQFTIYSQKGKSEREKYAYVHIRTHPHIRTPFLLIFSQRTYTFIICFYIYFSLEIKKYGNKSAFIPRKHDLTEMV